jgi:hypothetical protein
MGTKVLKAKAMELLDLKIRRIKVRDRSTEPQVSRFSF